MDCLRLINPHRVTPLLTAPSDTQCGIMVKLEAPRMGFARMRVLSETHSDRKNESYLKTAILYLIRFPK